MFSILAGLIDLEGVLVLDLFAGSGALGIEALSRGAAHAVFVDSSAAAVEAIKANLAVLDAPAGATVVKSDAVRFVASASRADVVMADPPYNFAKWAELLDALVGRAGLLVAETGTRWEPGPAWETVKVKTYGGTVVTVAQPLVRPADGPKKV
jgi:16S rRNA (guanine966-N2)-methyltransferase